MVLLKDWDWPAERKFESSIGYHFKHLNINKTSIFLYNLLYIKSPINVIINLDKIQK